MGDISGRNLRTGTDRVLPLPSIPLSGLDGRRLRTSVLLARRLVQHVDLAGRFTSSILGISDTHISKEVSEKGVGTDQR